MKRKIFMLLFALYLVLITACGENNTKSGNPNNDLTSPTKEATSNSGMTEESKGNTDNEVQKPIKFEELNEIVSTDIENTVSAIKSEYEELVTDIDTYEKYRENTDKVENFYKQVCEDTRHLCIRMREYSINYAKEIMASNQSNRGKYEDFEELYDCIYDDAGDDIYDEIYDGIFDNLYDDFYDGILDDAYDNGVSYAEWSETHSGEYHRWSDAHSGVYREWSDFRSDVYGFWSDMRSALWKDNIEKAEKEIADFQVDIEKRKNKSVGSDTQISNKEESGDVASENVGDGDVSSDEELVDGVRPEFKVTMDSYEAFYDEYCDIMRKYLANPTDTGLLASYTNLLAKMSKMTEEFEAWEDNEMNDAELKYYLDVNNRVTKKLLGLNE